MRKGILGLLAYCLTGLEIAQGQTVPGGGYQEPLPIQPPGARYGAQPYGVAAPSRFPNYGAPTYPAYVPAQTMPQPGPGYVVPLSYFATLNGAPPVPPNARPGNPSGVVQAAAQEPLPLPTAPLIAIPEIGQDQPPASPKGSSKESQGGGEPTEISSMGPAEPAEPYMVGPVGTWKPTKGYSFYGSAEYLLWWVRAQQLPANLSLSLSSPNTVPEITSPDHQGARFFLGVWLSDQQDLSAEVGYFYLWSRTANDTQNFGASPIAMIPKFSGIDSESVLVSSSTSFWGAEANLRYQAWRSNRADLEQDRPTNPNPVMTGHLDLLGGFRFVDLSESMTLNNTTLFSTAPVALSNALLTTSDSFGTHNHLFAGQIGADAGLSWGCLSANVYTKLAMGANQETVNINGLTQVTGPPVLGNPTAPGGFYAQPSNIGQHNRDVFSVLPEAGFNLGCKLGDHCRLAAGYTFVYFSNVVRPGQQIDATAGGATRPLTSFLGQPVPQPAFAFNNSGFWAQGVNFTIELSY